MSVEVINGSTVTEFVENGKSFEAYVEECFRKLDSNGDGMLSHQEFIDGFRKLLALECETMPKEEVGKLYEAILEKFDKDNNGTIELNEFRCLIKELMMAMARGIGDSPVLVALDGNSMLMRAVEHESQHGSTQRPI